MYFDDSRAEGGNVLPNYEISVVESRSMKLIAPDIAKRSNCFRLERGGVEPQMSPNMRIQELDRRDLLQRVRAKIVELCITCQRRKSEWIIHWYGDASLHRCYPAKLPSAD